MEHSYRVGLIYQALIELDVMDRVQEWSARTKGRVDWEPAPFPFMKSKPNIQELKDRKYPSVIIQRDRLAACLLEELEEKYSDRVCRRFYRGRKYGSQAFDKIASF